MKRLLLLVLFAAAAFAFAPTQASAWYCKARGTTGAWGWGQSPWLGNAKGIALRQCAVRTPPYARCYITYCN